MGPVLRRRGTAPGFDLRREQQAERTARELLRSCIPEHDWTIYDRHGFLTVEVDDDRYAYLIYPHKPIVAFVPETHELLAEYCVTFPDESRPYGSPRLPDADDVLAKWLMLTSDEAALLAAANVHVPGRQVDTDRIARDLARL